MSAHTKCKHLWIAIAVPFALSCVVSPLFGQNQVMGEVDFHGATKVEKSSGVWIDGQYVGYLKELKGMKKILLLPGGTRFLFARPATSTTHKESSWSLGRPNWFASRCKKSPERPCQR